jgi:hypothetical protein
MSSPNLNGRPPLLSGPELLMIGFGGWRRTVGGSAWSEQRWGLVDVSRIRIPYLVAGVLVALVVGGGIALVVGSGSSRGSTVGSAPTTRHIALPAGPKPSESAQMVCGSEGQDDIEQIIGQPTTTPPAPTWVDHLYSCQYIYASGVLTLSVKELSTEAQTRTYYTRLLGRLGRQQQLKGVAQGAYVTARGSVVLRKDYKVLLVDTSGIPNTFGTSGAPRKQLAIGVAVTVLGCWTGA